MQFSDCSTTVLYRTTLYSTRHLTESTFTPLPQQLTPRDAPCIYRSKRTNTFRPLSELHHIPQQTGNCTLANRWYVYRRFLLDIRIEVLARKNVSKLKACELSVLQALLSDSKS